MKRKPKNKPPIDTGKLRPSICVRNLYPGHLKIGNRITYIVPPIQWGTRPATESTPADE